MRGHLHLFFVLAAVVVVPAPADNPLRPVDKAAIDVQTTTIEPGELRPEATIQVGQQGAEIHPFIYGQFIEHLGRCIYGGIWAEMLEDRKFYFPITDQYAPYENGQETKFPVVRASPWEVLGPEGSVVMDGQHPLVGDHSPRIAAGSGIRQQDLWLIAGRIYDGTIWLSASESESTVRVSLAWGDDPSDRQTVSVTARGAAFTKHSFCFTSKSTTEKGRLEVRVESSSCHVGTVSLMPDNNVRGMRPDTLALLKQLNAPMYRWPGGNFVSGYDWRDGIGPRDRRPPRRNPAWTGVEHNDFGLDEFLDFCREVNAEPLIAVNTGFGDAYSAAQEVEYCNTGGDTVGGSWRLANGHAKPYQVKYWCVGNEMFGPWQLGFMQLRHYTEKHNRVSRAMLKADPSLALIGAGNLGGRNTRHDPDEKRGWSRGMLEDCTENMRFISEHFYISKVEDDTAAHIAQMVNAVRGKAEGHRRLQAGLANLKGRTIPIALDEWNYWHRPYEYGELGCVYRLRDALGIAAGLHEYFRNSDIIQMAHYAQTVNVIGCIKTTKTKAFLSTTALPLMLYRNHFGVTPVRVAGNYASLALDVVAALTADGRALTISAINPNGDQHALSLELEGAQVAPRGTGWCIRGDSPDGFNSAEQQTVAIGQSEDITFDHSMTLPPYSVTMVRLIIE